MSIKKDTEKRQTSRAPPQNLTTENWATLHEQTIEMNEHFDVASS